MTAVKMLVALDELLGCFQRRREDTCEVRKEFLDVALNALRYRIAVFGLANPGALFRAIQDDGRCDMFECAQPESGNCHCRDTFRELTAIADTHPKDGDGTAPLVSGGGAGTAIAPPPPLTNRERQAMTELLELGGPIIRCGDCRFWSQMVARSEGGGPVQALCLAGGGKLAGKYTSGRQIDCGFKPDLFGKVDDPPNYGEYTRQAYLDEEGRRSPRPRIPRTISNPGGRPMKRARPQADQALAVPAKPASGLDASRFDPSRIAAGQWALLPTYRGFDLKEVAKVTPKLVKFVALNWPRQATLLQVVASLESKEGAQRLKQSLEGALGTYEQRERAAREDFNARVATAKLAYEKKKRQLVGAAIAMEAGTAETPSGSVHDSADIAQNKSGA